MTSLEVKQFLKKYKPDHTNGFASPFFLDSLKQIINYYENQYPNKTIEAKDISDSKLFAEQKKEYSVAELILFRILNNIEKFVFFDTIYEEEKSKKPNFKPTTKIRKESVGCYVPQTKTLVVTYENRQQPLSIFEKNTLIHELLHAISTRDYQNPFGISSLVMDEGITEYIANDIAKIGLSSLEGQSIHENPKDDFTTEQYLMPENSNSPYCLYTCVAGLLDCVSNNTLKIGYLLGKSHLDFSQELRKFYNNNILKTIEFQFSNAFNIYKYEQYKTLPGYKNARVAPLHKSSKIVMDLQNYVLKIYNSTITKSYINSLNFEEKVKLFKQMTTTLNACILKFSFPKELSKRNQQNIMEKILFENSENITYLDNKEILTTYRLLDQKILYLESILDKELDKRNQLNENLEK